MSEKGPVSFAMVCEAPADSRTAAELADRVVCEDVAWMDAEMLDYMRKWQGLESGDPHLEWHEVGKIASSRFLPLEGMRAETSPSRRDRRSCEARRIEFGIIVG